MTLEQALFQIWGPLTGGRLYPGGLPDQPVFPAQCWNQSGGQAYWYLDNTLPDHRHARIQVDTFGRIHSDVRSIARATEAALAAASAAQGFAAQPLGAATSLPYNDVLKLYATRQIFSIWYPDPPN